MSSSRALRLREQHNKKGLDLVDRRRMSMMLFQSQRLGHLSEQAESFRERVYRVLEGGHSIGWWETGISCFIAVLILLVVMEVISQTVSWSDTNDKKRWEAFESIFSVFTGTVFTAELLLRYWSCVVDIKFTYPIKFCGLTIQCNTCKPEPRRSPRGSKLPTAAKPHPFWARVRFTVLPQTLIDILAICPFWLSLWIDLRTLVGLRLFRLLRLFRTGRFVHHLGFLGRVMIAKREMLFATFLLDLILLVCMSAAVYFVEKDHVDEEYGASKFTSIPSAMWWSTAALSTVGYGDMVPRTYLGKIIGGFCSILAIGLFGLPAGIISEGFVEEAARERKKRKAAIGTATKVMTRLLKRHLYASFNRWKWVTSYLRSKAEEVENVNGVNMCCPHCLKNIALRVTSLSVSRASTYGPTGSVWKHINRIPSLLQFREQNISSRPETFVQKQRSLRSLGLPPRPPRPHDETSPSIVKTDAEMVDSPELLAPDEQLVSIDNVDDLDAPMTGELAHRRVQMNAPLFSIREDDTPPPAGDDSPPPAPSVETGTLPRKATWSEVLAQAGPGE